ncbi:hypothetical protein HAX54_026685 [Datura stramonium]|uniref:Uncharacterized protein n=1 Tax=Datura stramonium TaxID=4076 RepID=A0ABS8V3W1_DATST|nr:hypothetical protein [Datura stramonium]
MRLHALSCHVMMMLPNETKRVTRFTNGLIYPIHLVVAQVAFTGESCLRVVDAAKDVELIRPSSRRGYSNYSGSFPQTIARRVCSECGDLGNYKRAYFKLSPYGLPQGSHVFTPKTTTQLARGGAQTGRGGTQTQTGLGGSYTGSQTEGGLG